jgi:hypothetical protein
MGATPQPDADTAAQRARRSTDRVNRDSFSSKPAARGSAAGDDVLA